MCLYTQKTNSDTSSHNIDQLFYTIILIWLPHIHDIMNMRNLPAMNNDRGLVTCLNTCTPTYVCSNTHDRCIYNVKIHVTVVSSYKYAWQLEERIITEDGH